MQLCTPNHVHCSPQAEAHVGTVSALPPTAEQVALVKTVVAQLQEVAAMDTELVKFLRKSAQQLQIEQPDNPDLIDLAELLS